MEKYATEKTLTTSDGTKLYLLDNKPHSLEHAAIQYPKALKKKDEYYIYGVKYDKEAWMEFKKNQNGVPFFKSSSMKVRT